MNKVNFISADKPVDLPNVNWYKKIVEKVFLLEKFKLKNISFIFCSDDYLLNMNKKYLNHNYYTDIITFLISIPEKSIESEVYISIESVHENAKIYKVSYQNELLRVIIHGALHLCGYNDKSVKEKKMMRDKENFYIQLYHDSHEP